MMYLLPGMGADISYYEKCTFNPSVRVINWIPALTNESLKNYAKRIIKFYNIQKSDSVGGSSFGGMVAASMCSHLSCKKLVLIGSCSKPNQINPMLLRMAPIGHVLPINLIPPPFSSFAFYSPKIVRMGIKNTGFIHWALGALAKWRGESLDLSNTYHIHGSDDRIIPCGRVSPTVIVPGGHLIAWEKPTQISFFVNKISANESLHRTIN